MNLDEATAEFQRNFIRDLLVAENGNVKRAAARAGRNRTEFHRLIKRHGLVAREFRLRLPAQVSDASNTCSS